MTDKTTEIKLKPCPFCGEEKIKVHTDSNCVYCQCTNCKIKGRKLLISNCNTTQSLTDRLNECKMLWNTRAEDKVKLDEDGLYDFLMNHYICKPIFSCKIFELVKEICKKFCKESIIFPEKKYCRKHEVNYCHKSCHLCIKNHNINETIDEIKRINNIKDN